MRDYELGGSMDVVKFFCQILSETTCVDLWGWTALHYAAHEGHLKLVKFLAEIIPIDIRNKKNETACDIAENNNLPLVAEFLKSWTLKKSRLPNETRHG